MSASHTTTKLPNSLTKIIDCTTLNNDTNIGGGSGVGGVGFFAPTTTMLSKPEASSIIESLRPFPVEEVGCSPFLQMYGYEVERLNLEAHACVQRQDGDEHVVHGILLYNKLDTLIQTLIAVETWRLLVLKHVERNGDEGNYSFLEGLVENKSSLRCSFILHVETTLVNLLNLILYHRESCEALSSESALALVDYCARQMTALSIPVASNEMVRRQKEPQTIGNMTQKIQDTSTTTSPSSSDDLWNTILSTEFKSAVASVSLARYLCEYIEEMSLSVQTRILDTHDFLVMTVPLIDEPPWTRRRELNGTVLWEKLAQNNEWKEVQPTDLLQITQCEAQCWFTIFFLTCSNACRKVYGLNSFRKGQLLRLRKFLNNYIIDQIPVLGDVMRYMDELSLMAVPDASTGQGSALLMQQVETIRHSLTKGRDWSRVGRDQMDSIFSKCNDMNDEDLRLIAQIYNEESVADIIGEAKAFDPLMLPLEIATIRLEVNGTFKDVFTLKAKGKGDIVKTKSGLFRRSKLIIHQIDDGDTTLVIQPTSKIEALFTFQGLPDFTKKISLNLKLPQGSKDSQNKQQNKSSIRWSQMGSLGEKLVLQLGFKQCSGDGFNEDDEKENVAYTIVQAHLSQPTPED